MPRPLILDGGLGTALESRGHDLLSDSWSGSVLASDPEEIKQVHASFFRSGAQVATTASYQLSGKDPSHVQLCSLSVSVARRAAEETECLSPGGRFVIGSVGSHGAWLGDGQEFTGEFAGERGARESCLGHHIPKARALCAAGCDALVLETVPSADEAHWFAEWVSSAHSGVSVPVLFSFSARSDGVSTGRGECLASAAKGIADRVSPSQLASIGVNCCDPRAVTTALTAIGKVSRGAGLTAYPNMGGQWDTGARKWIEDGALGPEEFAKGVVEWTESVPGITAIGGCCRVGPEHIAAVRAALE